MAYIAFCIAFVGGMSAGTYLVTNGHPWFAVLVFLITGSMELKSNRTENTESDAG